MLAYSHVICDRASFIILNTTLPYYLFLQDDQRIFLFYPLNHHSFVVSLTLPLLGS